MATEENSSTKSAGENFSELFEAFGSAISQIFNDPELKEKAKEFGRSAAGSADAFAGRFRDEEVREKFRDVGKAAQEFGKSVSECFKEKKSQADKAD